MSLIKLQGNASGTGAFTIAAPNSNTDRTLTLPDTTGTIVMNEGSGIFKIDSSGNVGIGTSSPAHELDIQATGDTFLRVKANSSGAGADDDAYLVLDTTETGEAVLSFRQDGVEKALIEFFSGGGPDVNFTTVAGTGANFDFQPEGALAMRIDSSGRLLLGKTSFTNAGEGFIFSIEAGDGAVQRVTRANNTNTQSHFRTIRYDGTSIGSITTSNTATQYNTSSDYRLKEDWQPMTGASERVLALKPVNFAWKVDGSRVDGFLAHEVQEVVHEAVAGEKDAVDADGNPQYQGIDQSKLVPLLTAALQEALAEIANLKTRLTALEAN